jgi:hypothetical protein
MRDDTSSSLSSYKQDGSKSRGLWTIRSELQSESAAWRKGSRRSTRHHLPVPRCVGAAHESTAESRFISLQQL